MVKFQYIGKYIPACIIAAFLEVIKATQSAVLHAGVGEGVGEDGVVPVE